MRTITLAALLACSACACLKPPPQFASRDTFTRYPQEGDIFVCMVSDGGALCERVTLPADGDGDGADAGGDEGWVLPDGALKRERL